MRQSTIENAKKRILKAGRFTYNYGLAKIIILPLAFWYFSRNEQYYNFLNFSSIDLVYNLIIAVILIIFGRKVIHKIDKNTKKHLIILIIVTVISGISHIMSTSDILFTIMAILFIYLLAALITLNKLLKEKNY